MNEDRTDKRTDGSIHSHTQAWSNHGENWEGAVTFRQAGRHCQTDRQTDRQTERQADRQGWRQADREAYRHAEYFKEELVANKSRPTALVTFARCQATHKQSAFHAT